MKKKQLVSSGTKWEDIVGYSRGVRVGNVIEIAGTTAIKDGEVIGIGDSYIQTQEILLIIKKTIEDLGGSLKNVVRTRIFVTDISQWKEIGRAHGEFFCEIKPVTTMIEVKSLINPELLVEIEATAILEI